MSASHTPGPWEVFVDSDTGADRSPGVDAADGTSVVIFGEEGEWGVGVQGETPEIAQANARLIAAAPELLSACELMDGCHGRSQWAMDTLSERERKAVLAIRAAIAKAKGGAL